MIIITKIDNHKEINKNLLSLIDKIPKNKLLEKVDIIDNTDWNLSTDIKKEYVEYFISIINPYLKKMASQLMSNSYDITNIWFQQYSKLGTHGWHNHPRSNWTNVYFVELPDKSLVTELMNHDKIDLEEGCLLTFPAHIYHRSPPNIYNNKKTIISFNSNFFDFNG